MTKAHPWQLVAPWYRWSHPGVPASGRGSRPMLQKYDGATLVAEFMQEPQRSLKFTTDDLVHEVRALDPLNPPTYLGKLRRLSALGYLPTTTRKLFLDTHKRFNLIVCELHSDMPGFPSVKRDEVCEAGFVIRRRIEPQLSPAVLTEVKPILKSLGTARRGVSQLAAEQLQNARASFTQWAEKFGIHLRLQGWQVLRYGIGQWVDVEETPTAPAEQLFRLYPLIPDPRNTSHSARGRTIYFGTVPTGSADTDEFGKARFDDITQYEIRCYVRRHKPQCPKSSQKPDCHGELIWSLPGEPYQLAAHFDLVGTSNRAVSMQLPDLAALEAQAAARAPNQLAPFRMVSPPDSNLEFDADDSGNASNPHKSSQICSFSIPLITIVATFVFKLFLPVVTLLFGLFFLLKLKFCIPPSIELSAGVAAELNATLQLGLDISVDAKLAIGTPLGNAIDASVNAGLGGDLAAGLKSAFGPRVIGQMANDVYQSGQQQNAPSLTAKLEYEDIVQAEVRI
jgi:hypothetical protein